MKWRCGFLFVRSGLHGVSSVGSTRKFSHRFSWYEVEFWYDGQSLVVHWDDLIELCPVLFSLDVVALNKGVQ